MSPRVYVTTSWDDGHACDLRVAEMLVRHGLRGTFYAPRAFRLGVIPPSTYTTLGPDIEVGAHTLGHVMLTRTPDPRAEHEIAESKKWIEDQTGKRCTMFCPPSGRFASRHLKMVARAGFLGLRTVEGWSLDEPRLKNGVLVMPTTVQAHPIGPLPHLRNLTKRGAVRGLRRYARQGVGRSWRHALERCINEAAGRGGVLHLWGHSWEVDAADQWDALEGAFARLAEFCAQPGVEVMTNGQLVRAFAPRVKPVPQDPPSLSTPTRLQVMR